LTFKRGFFLPEETTPARFFRSFGNFSNVFLPAWLGFFVGIGIDSENFETA